MNKANADLAMEVMNVLRRHSKPNSKQPRRRHLGSIVRSFVGITDLFGEKGVPEAMFQFKKEPDGGNKLPQPSVKMVSDGSAITTENDFARYAIFWLRVVSHTVKASDGLVDVRADFINKALSDKPLLLELDD